MIGQWHRRRHHNILKWFGMHDWNWTIVSACFLCQESVPCEDFVATCGVVKILMHLYSCDPDVVFSWLFPIQSQTRTKSLKFGASWKWIQFFVECWGPVPKSKVPKKCQTTGAGEIVWRQGIIFTKNQGCTTLVHNKSVFSGRNAAIQNVFFWHRTIAGFLLRGRRHGCHLWCPLGRRW